ncbi:hypothetical protein KDK95_19725 [Actinospica sp. MGRD01-02]|uniref:Uncharacterized protein n=1 Tax=Actinospica acidithermotolerans TaxID=2828514 RepID=A0A941IMG8_9ACTN|nr:hypothetical protein [Actinospica acidithermotolerans]MBR7828551.1 hypothetical protein [Actinospica acidithermotolerans]
MDYGTSAWSNLTGLFHCAQNGGDPCALMTGGDGGVLGFALVIVLALNIGGVIVSYQGLVLATDAAAVRLTDKHRLNANAAIGVVSACLWWYLWLAYALPECSGHTVLTWMIISPLFTLVLMVGFIGTVAAVAFTVGNVVARQHAGDRGVRVLLTAVVTGLLIGWHILYDAVPQIAAGPYGRGPGWFQDALGIWTLRWPVSSLWGLATVLATTPGIATFAALGALAVILPRRTSSATAANLAFVATTSAIGELAGLVIGACVLIVMSLLVIAVAALAFMFFAAYVMAYALVLAFLGALVVGALRR